jgi:molybdopterin/thiamine biosynthesis adenylyltransferase
MDGAQLEGWRRRSDGSWSREDIDLLPAPSEVFSRNRGLLESDALAQKTVAIVGLGSGGSIIALELAKAGVGRFILADFDRLEVSNIGRHVCDLADVGRRKTVAMRDQILRRNPYAKIKLFDGDITERLEELEVLLDHADVIVAATDNNASRNLLNRYAVETGVPMILGRVYTRASGGDVIAVRPGGPCYTCIADAIPADEEVSSERDLPAYADHAVKIEPGLALDIAPVAHMCTRLVILELIRHTKLELTSLLADLSCPIMLWANRRDERFAAWPVMGQRVDGLAVQRWFGVYAERMEACPACQPEAYAASLLDPHVALSDTPNCEE